MNCILPCALWPAAGGTTSEGGVDVRRRHEGFNHTATKGTRPTQSTKVRHTPRRSVPRYVSPFVGARNPVQSGQVGAGRTAQQRAPGISPPSPGVRRTFHHPVGSGVPVEARPGFGSKDILLFSFHGTTVRATLSTIVVCTATHMQGDPYMHTHHITPSWEYVNSVRARHLPVPIMRRITQPVERLPLQK